MDNTDKKTIDLFNESNRDMVMQIIEFYKQNPMHWNPNCKDYARFYKKVESMESLRLQIELSFGLGLTLKDLRKIIRKLRNHYYKNDSSVWFNEHLQFLPPEEEYKKHSKKKIEKSKIESLLNHVTDILINYPVLWNVNFDGYRSRQKRDETIIEMSKEIKMEHSKEELRLALARIRNYYFGEKSKRLEAEAAKTTFEPSNMELYNKLRYMDDHIGPFKCNYDDCDVGLIKGYDTYQTHVAAHEGRKPFCCNFCQQELCSYIKLKFHIQRKHSQGQNQFKCSTCSKTFRTLADLKTHELIHVEAKDFVCNLCGKTFHTNAYLNRHIRRNHEMDKYQYKCSYCPKKYYDSYRLKDHLNSHLNIRDNICSECGKGFFSLHLLRQHLKLHGIKSLSKSS